MRTWILAALVALVLVAAPAATLALHHDGVTTAQAVSAGASDATSTREAHENDRAGRKAERAERKAERRERRADRREWRTERREHRWERRQKRSERVGPDRAAAMARRAQEHAEGMKAWAACVKEAGDDPAKRVDCERPMPPGLAKRR